MIEMKKLKKTRMKTKTAIKTMEIKTETITMMKTTPKTENKKMMMMMMVGQSR